MATEYIVLRRVTLPGKQDDTTGWITVGKASAASSGAAIRAHLNGADEGGEFVAVPARSWAPVHVEVTRAIKLS